MFFLASASAGNDNFLMAFEFLNRFRTPPRRTANRAEWENIIRLVVMDFEDGAQCWFGACLVLLKEHESEFRPSPRLAGEAELATIVVQFAGALDFISSKQYIPPESGGDSATHLFDAITLGKDVRLAKELYKLHLAAQGHNEAGEIIHLCGLVAECILGSDDISANMTIAETIPLFTRLNYCTVARAFNDHETLRELENRR